MVNPIQKKISKTAASIGRRLRSYPPLKEQAYSDLKSVCILLGPYRNLTTLVTSILSLHPTCQALNHAGRRILRIRRLDFLRNASEKSLRRFLQFAIDESQGGKHGNYGGTITASHAFQNHGAMREAYQSRFGDSLIKEKVECLVWKESLNVANHIRDKNVNLKRLLDQLGTVRFFLPVRNPMDCAVSNMKTKHHKLFRDCDVTDVKDVCRAIVREIAWVHEKRELAPERFFVFFQDDMSEQKMRDLAGFLGVEADSRWLHDTQNVYDLKASYQHDTELVKAYESAIAQYFPSGGEVAEHLRSFIV